MGFSFGPVRIAKREWMRPWGIDPFGHHDSGRTGDPEKHGLDEESDSDYDTSEASSRSTSTSLSPMLQDLSSYRRMASAYDDRIPRKQFNLYFTIAIAFLLTVFILSLFRLAYTSSRRFDSAPPAAPSYPYESFSFLGRYYGGIRTLVARSDNMPEYPGDPEELRDDLLKSATTGNLQKRQDMSETGANDIPTHNLPTTNPFDPFVDTDPGRRECFLDPQSTIRVPELRTYDGCVRGFPDHVIGSYDIFGLRNDVCFDRFGRLGPYGWGYSADKGGSGAGLKGDKENAAVVWADAPQVDYGKVHWADAVSRCAENNVHRFTTGLHKTDPSSILTAKRESGEDPAEPSSDATTTTEDTSSAELIAKRERSCIVIRTYHDYHYDPESLMYLRSLVAELSLQSGTEYVVHFLIQVRDNDLPIWANDDEYQRVLNESLPEEFRGMGSLWSDQQLMMIYNGLNTELFRHIHLHSAYRSSFMPLQYFAYRHPEFDSFWNWEMDIRYSGHWYHLFDRVTAWAKQQPRKGLWERNARFYVPSIHGSWDDFRHMVRMQTDHGTASPVNHSSGHGANVKSDSKLEFGPAEKSVWGAESSILDSLDTTGDPVPPTSYANDAYSWGVDEDADLITFNPLFDPSNTGWNLEKDVTGYNTSTGVYPPRRAAIISASRLSRRLLRAMHDETSLHKRTMFSEMWPASCALQHGFKAVYAPHPVFIDRRWPTDYLAAVINAGRNGATGGAPTMAFNDAHHDNFRGVSWYYHSGFSGNLWRRWLGLRVDGGGGPEAELAEEGRMCLPAMLFHPVKEFDLDL